MVRPLPPKDESEKRTYIYVYMLGKIFWMPSSNVEITANVRILSALYRSINKILINGQIIDTNMCTYSLTHLSIMQEKFQLLINFVVFNFNLFDKIVMRLIYFVRMMDFGAFRKMPVCLFVRCLLADLSKYFVNTVE